MTPAEARALLADPYKRAQVALGLTAVLVVNPAAAETIRTTQEALSRAVQRTRKEAD